MISRQRFGLVMMLLVIMVYISGGPVHVPAVVWAAVFCAGAVAFIYSDRQY